MNRETAITQKGLNSSNQVTPYGTLSWEQTGKWEDGTPRYTSTTNLSPEQQELYRLQTQTQTNLGNIGVEQSDKIRQLLGTNVDLSNEALESHLFDLGSSRMNPVFGQQEESMRNDLINRGIREGTPAFEAEMTRFNQGKNDFYGQLFLNGRGQAMNEILTARNQPLNEITALMSGSQVSQPNFRNEAQTPVSGVDYAGLVQGNFANEMAGHNAMIGGLAGLGGAAAGAGAKMWAASDRRLKTDIRRVGTHERLGIGIYTYRFKGHDTVQMGVMADELAQVLPHAVMDMGEFLAVDYSEL